MANTGIFESEDYNPLNEAVHHARLSFIADYIHKRIQEDEGGEPPDNDTLLEALGLPDKYDTIIDEAYELYYGRGGSTFYED
ncbi:hypothetical protein P59_158 [Bacillus phage P59]|nr:hypothetical protein P59_158 [Bacillus phage P59]